MEWLKKAFAVSGSQTPPSPEELQLVDSLAAEIVNRGMEVPAIAFLELARPLRSISLQGLYSAAPFIGALYTQDKLETLQKFLSRSDSIDRLCDLIESKTDQKSEPVGASSATASSATL